MTSVKKQLSLNLLPSTFHPSFQAFQLLSRFLWYLPTVFQLRCPSAISGFIAFHHYLLTSGNRHLLFVEFGYFLNTPRILAISCVLKIEAIKIASSASLTAGV